MRLYSTEAESCAQRVGKERVAFVNTNDDDLFEPYEKLISIEILGRWVKVPENNHLLRCFQFLSMRTISYGDFCLHDDCARREFKYRGDGQMRRDARAALACRFCVREGLVITDLNRFIELEGINK